MKKWTTALLACLLAAPLIAAPAANAKKTAAKQKAEFIVIESPMYEAGKEDTRLTAAIGQFLNAEPVVTRVTPDQAAADPKLAGIKYDFLPMYILKKTLAVMKKMDEPLKGGYFQQTEDFILLPHQTQQGVFMGKQSKPNVMELFVMSQCPFGVRAENFVIEAKKNGTFPTDKDLKIRYIVSYNDRNGFNSLHGSGEWEENVRQLLIAKYYPEKFWKYLEIRNKDYRSSRWDKAMEQAGINMKKIMKKFDTEGLALLKEEAAYSQSYNIGASPSFLWEGQVQLDFGSAAQVDGFGFLNPQTPAGQQAPAAPAGQC